MLDAHRNGRIVDFPARGPRFCPALPY